MTRETKRTLILDVILVAVLLVISLSALLIYTLVTAPPPEEEDVSVTQPNDGDESGEEKPTNLIAVVRLGNEVIGRYPLAVDGEYAINGGTNRIRIENGSVRMVYSTCPGYQDCVEHGAISHTEQQSIVCLPNRIIVSVEEP